MPKSSTKGRGTSRGRGDERDFATVCGARQWRGAAGAVTTAAALFVTTHYQNFDSRVSTLKKFHVHTCKFQDECGLYYIFIK